MKHFNVILILAFTFFIAACDSPKSKKTDKSVAYSFAFDKNSYEVEYTTNGTYNKPVSETSKPTGDTRDIVYTSSNKAIATVDNAGVVSFVSLGKVTITATKEASDGYDEITDSYKLNIEKFKPQLKDALVAEIERATTAKGNMVDLNYIDTSAITDMSSLFRKDHEVSLEVEGYGFHEFNGDISMWDTSKVRTMEEMFQDNTVFNIDISGWKVLEVENMRQMFVGATSFNQNIGTWNVAAVTDMKSMFESATSFNQNIGTWNVAAVTDMRSMFQSATSFNQDISDWDMRAVTNIAYMFKNANAFNQDLQKWGNYFKFKRIYKRDMFLREFLPVFSRFPTWCKGPCAKKRPD